MTRDELLFKIYEIHNNSSDAGQEANKQYKGMIKFMQALRAVVELHKPTEAWGDTHCGFCFNLAWEPSGLEMMDKHFAYPCPTIQAIEKELQ